MQLPRRAHFIGIGGVGMSAVASLLTDAGVEVTGSDEAVYPPVSNFLAKARLPYRTPYAPENIPSDVDLIVIGKNAKLVPETNAEVTEAFARGVRVASFPEILAELAREKRVILVAGSYGKSTSAALLAHCLERAGKDPSYFIGASPLSPEGPARFGKGEYFVIEGDEYPSSNTDPRSKFLHFSPAHLLVTPLAHDHLNVFPTPESYLAPFRELTSLLPSEGALVVSTAGPLSREFLNGLSRTAVTYGLTEGDYTAAEIAWGQESAFTLTRGGERIGELRTTLLGEHNIENIVGICALALERGLLTRDELASGVASFRGVRRRMDRKSESTSIPVYEGFGSSREKLISAVATMKKHFPDRRLLVVFEPHTISWRNREALPWYDSAFEGAAKVYVFEPPQDGKRQTLSLSEMTGRIAASGTEAYGAARPEEVISALERDLRAGDAILISSSGELGGLIEEIPKLAERLFPL